MNKEITTKKTELINYLQYYLSKRFFMSKVFEGIINRLKSNYMITEKQFNSIIKFLEREPKFKNRNRQQIYEYFYPLISQSKEKELIEYESNTLIEFFQ